MALTDILPRALSRRPRPLGERLARMTALARQRRALGDLDPHLLRDIGVSRDEALEEAARLPWDASAHWHG